MQIYVGNIPFKATEEELNALFSTYGEVTSVKLVNDKETGRFRGFGFVEMADQTAGQEAVEALEGYEFIGRPLKVNEAKPRAPRPPRAPRTPRNNW